MNLRKTRRCVSPGRRSNFANAADLISPYQYSSDSGSVTDAFLNSFLSPYSYAPIALAGAAGAFKSRNPNNPLVPVANLVAPAFSIGRFLVDVGRNKGEGISGNALSLAANLGAQFAAYKAAEAAARKLSKNKETVATSPSVYAPQGAQVTYQSPDNTVYGGRSYYSRPRFSQNFDNAYDFGGTWGFPGPTPASGSGTTGTTGTTGTSQNSPTPQGASNGSTDYYDFTINGQTFGQLSGLDVAKGLGSLYELDKTDPKKVKLKADAASYFLNSPSIAKHGLPKGKLGKVIQQNLLGTVMGNSTELAKLIDPKIRSLEAANAIKYTPWYNQSKVSEMIGAWIPGTATYKDIQLKKAQKEAIKRFAEDQAYRAEDTLYDIQSGRYNNTIPDILADLGRGLKTGIPSVVEGLQGMYGGEKSTGNWATRNREGLLTLGGLGGLGLLGLLGYGLYRGRQRDNMMRGYYPY